MITSTNFDVGQELLEHFAHMANLTLSYIHSGAFIMLIVEHFHFQHGYKVLESPKEIDIEARRKMEVIFGHEAISLLLRTSTFVLPHTALTTIFLREIWYMDTPAHRAWMNNGNSDTLGTSTTSCRGRASGMSVIKSSGVPSIPSSLSSKY